MNKYEKIVPKIPEDVKITQERIYDEKFKGSVPINAMAYMIISYWDGKTSIKETADIIFKKFNSVDFNDILKDIYSLYVDLDSLKLIDNFNRNKILLFKEAVNLAESYTILRRIHEAIKFIYKIFYNIHNFYFGFLRNIIAKGVDENE